MTVVVPGRTVGEVVVVLIVALDGAVDVVFGCSSAPVPSVISCGRVAVSWNVADGRIGALTDVVPTVVVAAEVVVVVVAISSGDVAKSEVDERVGKRVDCGVGRLEILLRRTNGLFCGLLIVTDNRANSAVM